VLDTEESVFSFPENLEGGCQSAAFFFLKKPSSQTANYIAVIASRLILVFYTVIIESKTGGKACKISGKRQSC